MVGFTVEHDFGDLLKNATKLQKQQLPFATSVAMNNTLNKVKDAEEREIRDVFDRPTPYIQSSVFIKRSNKRNLTGTVGLKDQATKAVPASKILTAQITGGTRRLKRYEVALKAKGFLPDGYFTVPGEGVKLDEYGNISKGLIIQMLSSLEAFNESGFRANASEKTLLRRRKGTKKKAGTSFFVGRPGDRLPLGVWMRSHLGRSTGPIQPLRPILIFVPFALYQKTLDFQFVAENTIKKQFSREFNKAYRQAILTAK